MDEVMADALAEHLLRYNRDHNESLTLADLQGKALWDVVSTDRHHIIEGYLRSSDFFENLAVMPESQRVMRRLSMNYDVFIATAAMEVPTSFQQKYRWLAKHFPFIPASHIVFCGDKTIVDADYLIDDRPRHFAKFRGQGLLFSAPHNAGETRYTRVGSWKEVRAHFARLDSRPENCQPPNAPDAIGAHA
jgi:5'(3')-deoxyribonucleotidase